jgi:hypothetical protein
MPREHGEALVLRLQQSLQRIEGVSSARVVLNHHGEITDIHLVGLPSRKAKQIVRDVESLIHAQFDMPVDYRCISLVQLGGESATGTRQRVRFVSARPHPNDPHCVQVVLSCDQHHYEGIAALNAGEQEQRAPAVANATLCALQGLVANSVKLRTQEARIITSSEQNVSLTVVEVSTLRGNECLSGTALVNDNEFEAVARATLDALNRRLPVWMAQRHVEEAQSAARSEAKTAKSTG